MVQEKPRRRKRTTRRSAVVGERVARTAITLGGIGTILAVSLIFVFLAWVVLPLLSSPRVEGRNSFAARELAAAPLHLGLDEERVLAWTLRRDGTCELTALQTGQSLALLEPFGETPPSSASFDLSSDAALFGFPDGSIRLGRIGFESHYLKDEETPASLAGLAPGATAVHGDGVVQRTAIGQLRYTSLQVELEEPLSTGTSSPVLFVDHSRTPQGIYLVALHADGMVRVSRVREQEDWMTGEIKRTLDHVDLPRGEAALARPAPLGVWVGGLGQQAYVVWSDGLVAHWGLSTFASPELIEELRVVDEGRTIRSVGFVAGKGTLVIADSAGDLRTWFPARAEGESSGHPRLVLAQELHTGASPAVRLAASPRSRLLAAAQEDGAVRVYQATLGDEVIRLPSESSALALAFSPKEDALVARTARGITTWEVELGYPEAKLKALFRPVQYEGYAQPTHFWQSGGGTDDLEPKLGMLPLVFGTIKATFYSMIFGAPLAILAAIFTSEFLSPRLRGPVKTMVELMASLPSVVLGFISALVIAPFVQSALPAVLISFLAVPLATLLGAYLWQMLPADRAIRLSGLPRFLTVGLTVPAGIGLAVLLSSPVESLFFGGDMEAWLDGQRGGAFGGWLFLLLPLAALAMALGFHLFVNPRTRAKSTDWDRRRTARHEFRKFAFGITGALLLAALTAGLLHGLGIDPRGGLIDTYVQRNALIVGFAMGFAIVPIIYTLTEDALSEVPGQLREGSLGAGATTWQTALRIVLPFAMSGIFSALMIGLGRAVGETMIVLMAAGNTPLMEWNVFNGFRTLSANVATELPEAAVNSAHYRALFLAGLVLFAMTFVLNTAAELVRRVFRKRMQAL